MALNPNQQLFIVSYLVMNAQTTSSHWELCMGCGDTMTSILPHIVCHLCSVTVGLAQLYRWEATVHICTFIPTPVLKNVSANLLVSSVCVCVRVCVCACACVCAVCGYRSVCGCGCIQESDVD